MQRVSAIIPAYNEADRVAGVLTVLREVPELCEILVVDDCSTDGTRNDVCTAAQADSRIRLLKMPSNRGKGQAVLAGVRTISSGFLLLLDADLMALRPEHIRALMAPVTSGQADMSLGLFRGGRFNTDLGHIGTPWLTGQRCLKRDLFKYLTDEKASGYGLEIALTLAAQVHNYRVERVILRGVWHPSSEFHRGFGKAIAWRARMYGQIWNAWFANNGPLALRLYVGRKVAQIWQGPRGAWQTARGRASRSRE